MFAKIIAWFFTGGVTALGKIGLDFYTKKLEAENSTEVTVANIMQRELAVNEKEAEFDSRLLIAEQGNWITRWVRPLWAAPFIIWTWQAVVWDKIVCKWFYGVTGSTDPLDGMLGTLCITVATAYFGGRSLETVARIWQTRQGVTGRK